MVVGFIAVKANSRRAPRKNLRPFGGEPLFLRAVKQLLQVPYLSKVAVYTSDDRFREFLPQGVEFIKRPEWLDGDDVSGDQLFRSFAQQVESEHYLLSHSTAPFLSSASLEKLWPPVHSGEFDSAFTASARYTYAWMNGEPLNFPSKPPLPQTQELQPICLETNGGYLFSREQILTGRRVGDNPFIVRVSDIEAVDIDTEEDWALAEHLIEFAQKSSH